MEVHEMRTLGAYNAEVARGIVHTPEWKEKMRGFQEQFNEIYGLGIRTVGQCCHDADKYKAW